MHSARFGSPYAKVLPKNHFTLKKWGSPMPWSQPYYVQKPNRKLLTIYWNFCGILPEFTD